MNLRNGRWGREEEIEMNIRKLGRVEGVLDLHKSVNELSLNLHKSGNELVQVW